MQRLLERGSESEDTLFLTAMPDGSGGGDDTSDCSEATLADDDDSFASPVAQCCVRTSTPVNECPSPGVSPIPRCASWNVGDEESALSDLTTEQDDGGKGGGGDSSFEDSLAMTENSFVGEMRKIANEAVAQHHQGATQNGYSRMANGHLCNGPAAEVDDSDDEGLVEYDLDDISGVLDRAAAGVKAHEAVPPRAAWPPLEDGEEDEILTVNTLTHEITVRPAASVIFDGHEVLAGEEEEEEDAGSPSRGTLERRQQHASCRQREEVEDGAEDTDDTSSTGTSCTSTSGSFECLTREEADGASADDAGGEAEVGGGGGGEESAPAARPRSLDGSPGNLRRARTWDRGATPTKSALKKSAANRRQSGSSKGSTSLRKTVSFHDVISSVHHYAAEEEAPPSPPPSAPAIDYTGFRDWEFPLCLDEEFPEAANGNSSSSSEDEEAASLPLRGHRGQRTLPVRPRLTKLGSSFAPLYCIAALSQDDLPTTDEDDLPTTEVSLAEEPSEDLLVNQRPPWDSSMSDLSVLDASDDADSLRSDSPDEKRPPPPPLPTLRTTTIDLNANNFHPPHVAISEDANANSSL